ncbi:MAG: hypothetical protein AB7I33_15905 [Gemmatimonadales bacterium]
MPRLPRLVDTAEPFSYLRVIVGALLLAGTVVAVALAASGVAPRAILLVGSFWAIYGVFTAVVDGVLEPAIDGLGRLLSDVGLTRHEGFSDLESLVARGEIGLAADLYGQRARDHRSVEALARRAALLAGPLDRPEEAARELDAARDGWALATRDDIRVGLLLANLFEKRLHDPGRAMVELRRLIDRHPDSRHVRQMRRVLTDLKVAKFGEI